MHEGPFLEKKVRENIRIANGVFRQDDGRVSNRKVAN